jgi:hypothetical protein
MLGKIRMIHGIDKRDRGNTKTSSNERPYGDAQWHLALGTAFAGRLLRKKPIAAGAHHDDRS